MNKTSPISLRSMAVLVGRAKSVVIKAGESTETARRLGWEQLIFLAALPLVRSALQNRHATQAIALSDKSYPAECRHSLNGSTEASRA